MAENTKIEWAHHTFNPWVGCTKVSPACDHCYAEGWAKRSGMVQWGGRAERRRTSESNWRQPIKWNAEAERLGIRYRVFCSSLADVFDNAVPREWRVDLFNLILSTPHLDWLLLTKRIGNAKEMIEDTLPDNMKALPSDHPLAWPWPHVWIGATVCNQEEAERDIPKLLAVPAAKRFLSMEPLLGAVDVFSTATGELLHTSGKDCSSGGLDWIIVGGESGPGARPMHPEWAHGLRNQCRSAKVEFMFKQWGEWAPAEAIGDEMDRSLSEVWIGKDGSAIDGAEVNFFDGDAVLYRAGKKDAGRLLDGRTWDGVPA